MNTTRKTAKRYFVRIVDDKGERSVLSHRGRTEWTKKTAERYGSEFTRAHGYMTYIVEV